MDYLKEGIGLRAMAQRDPLVEYQREGYDMFMGMLDGLKEESVGLLFNAQVQAAPSPAVAVGRGAAEPRSVRRRRGSEGAGGAASRRPPRVPSPPRNVRRRHRLRCASRESTTTTLAPMTYSGPSEDGSARGAAARRR